MKKILKRLLTAALFCCAFALYAQVPDWIGDGTEDSPYQISTRADLDTLSRDVKETTTYSGKHFVMTRDIDMGDTPFCPIGCTYSRRFKGYFDGMNHTISNLKIVDTEHDDVGLFAVIDCSSDVSKTIQIKNLNIVNVDVSAVGTISQCAGILAGYSYGRVENIRVSGKVRGRYAGGLIGQVNPWANTELPKRFKTSLLFRGFCLILAKTRNCFRCLSLTRKIKLTKTPLQTPLQRACKRLQTALHTV